MLNGDQLLAKRASVEMAPNVVDADHDEKVVGIVGEHLLLKAIKKHLRRIAAGGGIEIFDMMIRHVRPCIDKNS